MSLSVFGFFAAEFSYFEMEMKFFAVVIDLSGSFLDC